MFRMTLHDHFWCVNWWDEHGDWHDEIFDSEEAAMRFAGAMDVDASICPPLPASMFVEDDA